MGQKGILKIQIVLFILAATDNGIHAYLTFFPFKTCSIEKYCSNVGNLFIARYSSLSSILYRFVIAKIFHLDTKH